MIDPAGGVYLYTYDANNNLSSVTYPDGKTKTYLYGEAVYTSGASLPHALTGIIDENNVRYATYRYDAQGRAYDEDHGANLPGGPVDHYNLVYNTDGSTIVTDPLGTARTYNFQTILGVVKSTGTNQPGGSGCGPAASNVTYDPNGNVATRTDFNGTTTTYIYDLTRNLETSRTEAVGKPEARTILSEWHPTFRLPTKVTEPGRVTENTYDPTSGNLLIKKITSTTDAKVRQWTYTYTTAGDNTLPNLLKSIDGPRPIADVVNYTYYPNGDLQTISNALGHVTQITQYDPHGRPQTIIDPNGITTTLTYKPRGWLESRTVAGESTSYQYDNVGQVTQVTFPNGSYVTYVYDDAHRLTDIYDTLGNRIHYTLDAIGNRTAETVSNNLGGLVTTKSRVFDALNRLWKDIGVLNQTTTYEYDPNGNLKKIDGPLPAQNDVTLHSYDALNRLATTTDGLLGLTTYKYDALDQLIEVKDPRNLFTQYTVNGLGDQTKLISPDTNTTNSSYDEAGNLKTRLDADNKQVAYDYDVLNRVTGISHDGVGVYTFSYDQGQHALGKLTGLTGGSGPVTYTYNAQGRIESKTQTAGVAYLITRYAYSPNGQLASITYPSGKLITYGYNPNGQINSISVNGQPLLANASYQPFGPVAGWTWGNNTPYNRSFDTDGRLVSYPLGSNTRILGFDDASRIQNTSDTNPAMNTTFTYDELDRLKSWLPPATNQSYDYDANGNRQNIIIGASSYSYTNSSTSNRLQSVAGPLPKSYAYNNAGNLTHDGTNIYSYNAAQRLTGITYPGGSSFYYLNALGQRTLKYGTGLTLTHFAYDEAGKLIGEYDVNGAAIEETIYLGDMPVAVMR